MKKLVLFFLCICGYTLYSQELHTPAQLIEIMEKSEKMYRIEVTELPFSIPNRSGKLNRNDFYVVDSLDTRILHEYDLPEDAVIHLDMAETHFQNNRYADARREYEKVLEIAPEYYKVLTYIAQTYGREQNFDEALNYYKKAIELNRIDYLAHMLIADIYSLKGDYQKAAYHITYAQILNRNNPRINQWLKDIYGKAKLKPLDFTFHPQMKLSSNEDSTEITVEASKLWMLYAICNSIWIFEPGYAESQGKEQDDFSLLEEKEGIVCLLTSLKSAKKKEKKLAEFVALQKALDAKMLDEYIIYEIWLPDYPWLSYRFSEKFLDIMVEYVMHVRGGKKLKS